MSNTDTALPTLTETDRTPDGLDYNGGTLERQWITPEGYVIRKFRNDAPKPAWRGNRNAVAGHRTVWHTLYRPDGSKVNANPGRNMTAIRESIARRMIVDARQGR